MTKDEARKFLEKYMTAVYTAKNIDALASDPTDADAKAFLEKYETVATAKDAIDVLATPDVVADTKADSKASDSADAVKSDDSTPAGTVDDVDADSDVADEK